MHHGSVYMEIMHLACRRQTLRLLHCSRRTCADVCISGLAQLNLSMCSFR